MRPIFARYFFAYLKYRIRDCFCGDIFIWLRGQKCHGCYQVLIRIGRLFRDCCARTKFLNRRPRSSHSGKYVEKIYTCQYYFLYLVHVDPVVVEQARCLTNENYREFDDIDLNRAERANVSMADILHASGPIMKKNKQNITYSF